MRVFCILFVLITTLSPGLLAQNFFERIADIPTIHEYTVMRDEYTKVNGLLTVQQKEVTITKTIQAFTVTSEGVMLGYSNEAVSDRQFYIGVSTDTGKHWNRITDDFDTQDVYIKTPQIRQALSLGKSLLFAFEPRFDGRERLMRSDDQGKTWQIISNINDFYKIERNRPSCAFPSAANIYVEYRNNAALSRDKGETWETIDKKERPSFASVRSRSGMGYSGIEYWSYNGEALLTDLETMQQRHSANNPGAAYYACSYHLVEPVEGQDVIYTYAYPAQCHSGQQNMRHLAGSVDGGRSWEITPMPQGDILFMGCENYLYLQLPVEGKGIGYFRRKPHGGEWEELLGMPNDKPYSYFTIGEDNHAYFMTEEGIYRSRESLCCGEADLSPSVTSAETFDCSTLERPSLTPTTITISATHRGKLNTGVYVEKGDYVCVVAKGELNYPTGSAFGAIKISPEGVEDNSVSVPYQAFNAAQLLIHHGGLLHGCEQLTLKGDKCDHPVLIDETFMQNEFSNEYGEYYIAQSDGEISLIINHVENTLINGRFTVDIYKLSKNQHRYRNCYNQCPQNEPQLQNNSFIDSEGHQWGNAAILPEMLSDLDILDGLIEDCYHPMTEEYRGMQGDNIVMGSQCTYDESSHILINSEEDLRLGTFDYGYLESKNRKLHYILDIFPHILYSKASSFRYYPTPSEKIY